MSIVLTTPSALSGVPEPLARNMAVRVIPGAERAVREGYPWLFAGSIREQSREGVPVTWLLSPIAKGASSPPVSTIRTRESTGASHSAGSRPRLSGSVSPIRWGRIPEWPASTFIRRRLCSDRASLQRSFLGV